MVDAFHLVQLANQALTAVRQRRAREVHDRRGRALDPAWANRRLLLRGADTLSTRAWDRLTRVFAADDPTGQLEWAWGVKEHLRMLLATTTLDGAATAMQTLRAVAKVAAMPEIDRLIATLETWWPAIEVVIVTGVTNARTEATNTTIKNTSEPAAGSAMRTTIAPVSCSPAPRRPLREHPSPGRVHHEPRRAPYPCARVRADAVRQHRAPRRHGERPESEGLDREVAATRMRADVSQAKPAPSRPSSKGPPRGSRRQVSRSSWAGFAHRSGPVSAGAAGPRPPLVGHRRQWPGLQTVAMST